MSRFRPIDGPRGPAPLALLVPYLLNRIGIGLAMVDARGWHAIHVAPAVEWELEFGAEPARAAYNDRCLSDAVRTRRAVLGCHGGKSDLFVPVLGDDGVHAFLVAGPFARTRPRGAHLLERWHDLSGAFGHLGDPAFARYAATELSVVVLDEERLAAFTRLLVVVAELVAFRRDAEALIGEAERLADIVAEATSAERMWAAAADMVDPATARIWTSPQRTDQLAELNLRHVPGHALVALLSARPDEPDPIDLLVRRDAFQRAAATLAHTRGDTACVRLGDHGIAFLLAPERRVARTRAHFADLAARASRVAGRFHLKLHFGASPTPRGPSLPDDYEAALAAAQEALSLGTSIVHADPRRTARGAGERARALLLHAPALPRELTARFERHIERATSRGGFRLEAVELELEIAFEVLAEPFVRSGALDARSYDDAYDALSRERESARSVNDVLVAYRRAVAALAMALERPAAAHRERNLGRALAFIRERIGGPIRRDQVARVAGFSPNHFSRLFRASEKVPFEHYVRALRVERAKQMLSRTTLSVERIAQLSGFATGPYFQRVFKEVAGTTPGAFRGEARARAPVRRTRAP